MPVTGLIAGSGLSRGDECLGGAPPVLTADRAIGRKAEPWERKRRGSAMTRLSVFSCLRLPEHVEAEMERAFRFQVAEGDKGHELIELGRLAALGAQFDAVITGVGCAPLDAAAIAALPASVQMIATYSVGTEHIDLEAARARRLAVANTPGTLIDAVADCAMLLMLGAARRATECIELIRSRSWPGWHPDQLLGVELGGRTLGIYGMGEIGTAVARRARAFGMTIAYSNPRPATEPDARYFADPLELVAASDVLLIAAPSTRATRGFVNADMLRRARPCLILVNIARGDLVVDRDLIAALAERRIFGAGLDVFAGEPDLDPGYYELPNLFMLPHIGSSTVEARAAMGASTIRSIRAFFAGETDPARLF